VLVVVVDHLPWLVVRLLILTLSLKLSLKILSRILSLSLILMIHPWLVVELVVQQQPKPLVHLYVSIEHI